MNEEEIMDLVEKTANAKTQTQDHIIRDLQLSLKSLIEIPVILKAHADEDLKAFHSIQKAMNNFEKRFDSLERMLKDQNEDSKEHRQTMKDHMDRVEPMISSYEKDNAFTRALGEKGKRWGGYAMGLAGLIGAFYIIKEFIIKVLYR